MKITKKDALALLRKAVGVRGPDYVDPMSVAGSGGCTYTKGDKPGCIVAQALHVAGLPTETLGALDRLLYSGMGGEGDPHIRAHSEWAPNWLREHGIVLTPGAQKAFGSAQITQDRGHTWGEALKAAAAAKVSR